jgi:hypothetical protein
MADVDEMLKAAQAVDRTEDDNAPDEGLYLERDTLLDDDFFEQSLDDYEDLLSDVEGGDWDA